MSAARRMGRWRGVLVGAVLLGLGAVIGAGAAAAVVVHKVRQIAEEPARLRVMVIDQIDRQYGLTEEQRARVSEVVERRFAAMRAIRLEAAPRVRAEMQKLEDEVAAEMTAEQASAWRSRVGRLRARVWGGER